LAGDTNWLRCSALAYLTRDPAWLVKQADAADADTSPDAIVTLLGLVWYHALARTPERGAFVQLWRDINAPRLQRLVAQRLPAVAAARRTARANLRVAIYTPQIINSNHGGTAITLSVMSLAARLGLECQAFTAQEATIPPANSHGGGLESLAQVSVDKESLVLNVPGNVEMVLPDGEFSLRFRFAQMLAAIFAYEPDLVIFVGFTSPLAYRLHAHYPVVGLSLHALPPIAPVDVWLSADVRADAALWPDVPVPQVASYPFRFWPKGQAVPVDREPIPIPAAAVALITTGNRLDAEMPPPWRERMLAFLEAHQEAHWLLVGVPEGQPVDGLRGHSRIHGAPHQSRLETWLAACDIYVNPPRMGGGGSVAMAMEQGLPVLTLAGGDGGDKVRDWAVTSMDAYFDRLSVWVRDAAARQQAGIALKAQFDASLDVSCTRAQEGLMQACHWATESFESRMRTP
jgi:glycosyltransferase involved in cell wall biosynthesis